MAIGRASPAWAEPDAYDAALAEHKPVPVSALSVIAKEPSKFLTQAVELSGRITGVLRGEIVSTVILKLDRGEIVHLLARPQHQIVAVGETARAVARLAEPPGESYTFDLLAMKWTSQPQAPVDRDQFCAELAQQQLAQAGDSGLVPAQPRYVLPSRGDPQPSRDRILTAYADTIKYFNPRLDERERYTIAKYIIDFSERIGVDARLVMAVVACESNFNQNATSRAGAMGLGQLMPATARGMGVRNAYDAKENLWAAIRIVRGHLENQQGDIALALACYNAGSGAVRRYGGVPPYRETQNYIRKVINLYLQLAPEMAR
ncbi:MAG: transglycosylase SLT domain-containing protein [Armatimonadota bacterium]|nr:MAG: transglycosylase SLT domain-containing protein [Armatimonadota bacterium]